MCSTACNPWKQVIWRTLIHTSLVDLESTEQLVHNFHVFTVERGKGTQNMQWGVGTQRAKWQHVIAISTYKLSPRISLAESSSPGVFVSSCFLIRKNRTVPTRLITVRAMKTVLRSLSVEKQRGAITRCAKKTFKPIQLPSRELVQTYYITLIC